MDIVGVEIDFQLATLKQTYIKAFQSGCEISNWRKEKSQDVGFLGDLNM